MSPLPATKMVGGAGYVAGKHIANKQQAEAPPQQAEASPQAAAAPVSSEADRIDALTKLKGLLDSGVLTQEQYEAERQKLLQGM